MKTTKAILLDAKTASKNACSLTQDIKNTALLKMADGLEKNEHSILSANEKDVTLAQGQIPDVMIDRLRLTPSRIHDMANGIRHVASLPDPISTVLEEKVLPNGLHLQKRRVPLGVVGIIYESRPNVTADAGALCFKSGNACVLRGGKNAFFSSQAIVNILRDALRRVGINENFINIVEDTSRESANEMMDAVGFIDCLIPRGGANLIATCVERAKVPCIQTGTGICHIYVDEMADVEKALAIIDNAKTSRPSVCNAAEVCLVHEKIAPVFLPLLQERLVEKRLNATLPPVELRCDEKSLPYLSSGKEANCEDFDTEFLDYILAVKTVANVEEAVEHISKHSTGHSECIVTNSSKNANTFVEKVDSAAVYVNASTRFTDGGEFGKGCEIGISTQKLHARGPMGLEELCSYKYVVRGNGQIR